jgi:peptide/nickel transport system permease protein
LSSLAAAELGAIEVHTTDSPSGWRAVLGRLLRQPSSVVGLVFVVGVVIVALLAPVLSPYSPSKIGVAAPLQNVSSHHLMGTDQLGRDEFSRVLYGARESILIGLVAMLWGLLIGGGAGLLAGGLRGRVDSLVMRLTDILLAFPGLLLAIGIASWLGPSEFSITLAVGIAAAPVFARLLRGSLIEVSEREFIAAARASGASRRRLLLRHLLPNAMTPVIVQAMLVLGTSIVDVAALGFLGLGSQNPGIAEWGAELISGDNTLQTAPWLVLFPAAALVVTVIGCNLLGDGLRQALDPRSRK